MISWTWYFPGNIWWWSEHIATKASSETSSGDPVSLFIRLYLHFSWSDFILLQGGIRWFVSSLASAVRERFGAKYLNKKWKGWLQNSGHQISKAGWWCWWQTKIGTFFIRFLRFMPRFLRLMPLLWIASGGYLAATVCDCSAIRTIANAIHHFFNTINRYFLFLPRK